MYRAQHPSVLSVNNEFDGTDTFSRSPVQTCDVHIEVGWGEWEGGGGEGRRRALSFAAAVH